MPISAQPEPPQHAIPTLKEIDSRRAVIQAGWGPRTEVRRRAVAIPHVRWIEPTSRKRRRLYAPEGISNIETGNPEDRARD
jgi:hypothetical protein